MRQLSTGIGDYRIFEVASEFAEVVRTSHRLPRVVAHNDCHPRNLYFSHDAENGMITYAADWASVGLGPIGLDGGTLIAGSINKGEEEALNAFDIEPQVFDAYLRGLHDAGYRFDRDQVRPGYLSNLVVMVLLYALIAADVPGGGRMATGYSAQFKADGDDLIATLAVRLPLLMPLFDEAVGLARSA